MSTRHIPYPPDFDVNYHEAQQAQRVQAALRQIDPGDVLAVIDRRIAAEPDPTQHPLYGLVLFCLDRQVAVHGGEFWDTWKRLVLAAIYTALDDALEAMEG
jgi:hypothetical protein